MALRSTMIRREYLDHDTGHWCNTCRLGTGNRIWVALHFPGRAQLQVLLWCSECRGDDVTIDPDVTIA